MKLFFLSDGRFAAKIERLSHYDDSRQSEDLADTFECLVENLIAKIKGNASPNTPFKWRYARSALPVAESIARVVAAHDAPTGRKFYLDMHSNNVMFRHRGRAKTLVITDPLA